MKKRIRLGTARSDFKDTPRATTAKKKKVRLGNQVSDFNKGK